MIGALIGDIVGSRFEFNNYRKKDFNLFDSTCTFTDDSLMTLAIANSLIVCNKDYSNLSEIATINMVDIGRRYPGRGYGSAFSVWLETSKQKPYNSFGNGAAMRVSPCAYVAKTLEEAKELSYKVTKVSHNHPEGIKGAEATTVAIYMALHGSTIAEIRDVINKKYYDLNFTLDQIRDSYKFNETCQETVPQAIVAFLESTSFEDAIRNAISIGGDSDTLAAITGGIAQAYYGIPENIKNKTLSYLDKDLLQIVLEFEDMISNK